MSVPGVGRRLGGLSGGRVCRARRRPLSSEEQAARWVHTGLTCHWRGEVGLQILAGDVLLLQI